jgi:hypothetical protein
VGVAGLVFSFKSTVVLVYTGFAVVGHVRPHLAGAFLVAFTLYYRFVATDLSVSAALLVANSPVGPWAHFAIDWACVHAFDSGARF